MPQLPSQKIRVTRTLVYEGDREWVEATLARSYIQIGENTYNRIDRKEFELNLPCGTIREAIRRTESI